MKKTHVYGLLTLCMLGFLCFSVRFERSQQEIIPENENQVYSESAIIASTTNDQFIDSLLDNAIAEYSTKGYFSSYYQPTLQATYQALSILHTIGGLSQVNETKIASYIIDHYTADNGSFIDKVALRYLDGDFSQQYYPLQTHMEITCYAVLSLNILDQLDNINVQEVRDFIWSCYQPVTSGFIGQPYDSNLDPRAKLSTIDNIYYALIALETLNFDWNLYPSQKNALVNFICSCQAGEGGFFNDKDYIFDSLDTYEPGLLSSFFAIHSLEVLNMVESIRINDFIDFLTELYDPIKHYFSISDYPYYINETNIIASAIGLDLSDVVSFTGIAREELVEFILKGRNILGGWSSSTRVAYHELIDSFQVVRSLQHAGEINSLSYDDLAELSTFVGRFRSHKGYAPLSPDYQAISQLNSLITSFQLTNRINELPLQWLYDNIEGVLFTFYNENGKEFGGATGMYLDRAWFRSNPIEYASRCAHDYIPYLNAFTSIKWTSLALKTLDMLYKLDDLGYDHDLTHMLNGVINSQFLDDGIMDLFGGFMNSIRMVRFSISAQVHTIFLENAYHAVQVIEILSNLLEINQNVSESLLNPNALINYIARNMVETDELYFQPRFGSATEDILEHTYQALSILRSLGVPDANHAKIDAYLRNHVDYGNIKNIYFCYKISELYELGFDFDIARTQSLVQATFYAASNTFFRDINCNEIEPQALAWVIEMAKNGDVSIAVEMGDIVSLGETQSITVSIGNLVLEQLGSYATVKLHTTLLGTQVFAVQADGSHQLSFIIPTEPSYFPLIEGNISVYDGLVEIKRKSVSFRTTYDLLTSHNWKNESSVFLISLNASQIFGTIKAPLYHGTAFGKIFKDDSYMRTIFMTRDDTESHSEFSLSYVPLNHGDYVIELFLNDGYNQTDLIIGKIFIEISQPPEILPNSNPLKQDEISLSVGLIIGFISLPGMTFFLSKHFLNRKKMNFK